VSFKRIDAEDFVVSSDAITSTLWSEDKPTLTEFFSSNTQLAGTSGNFYLSVYQTSSAEPSAQSQFSIAYGDDTGGGSTSYNGAIPSLTPTRSTYGQYRSLILENENSQFIFGDNTNQITGSHFWAISIDRARYKESILPGSFNLTISGSGGVIDLTDNSQDVLVNQFVGTSRAYQIISGSNGTASPSGGYVPNSGSYGLLFPELGTILLNPEALKESIGLTANRSIGILNSTNQQLLFTAISGGADFSLNSKETISSNYIFIRSRNSEFNYTENPTFIENNGEVIYDNYINNPQTYITTVGMYNDRNELLAVAKLSRPILKDFTKESLVRVKLDF
jgi:hypothetical protein